MMQPEANPQQSDSDVLDGGETPEQRRSRRAAVIWLICFVGGMYLLAIVLGLWLWISGILSV